MLGNPLTWDEWEKVSAEWANLKEIASDEKANNKRCRRFPVQPAAIWTDVEKYRKKNNFQV